MMALVTQVYCCPRVPVLLEPGSGQSYLLLRRYKKSIAYEAGRRILTLGCELRRERAILMCARNWGPKD